MSIISSGDESWEHVDKEDESASLDNQETPPERKPYSDVVRQTPPLTANEPRGKSPGKIS